MSDGWQLDSEGIAPGVRRLTVAYASERATFEDVFKAWASGDSLVGQWTQLLADMPFDAYNWELPAMRERRLDVPFECVVVDNPRLAQVTSEPQTFAEHFRADASVATFRNLRGDSVLIAPTPRGDFPHLAAFCRTGEPQQIADLWEAVGLAILREVSDTRVWLSTAGLGVYWLHVRLDPRPKYYRYEPYKTL